MNMCIWAIGTLNQLFIRGSYTQTKFSSTSEKASEVASEKGPSFFIGPFCTPHSISLLVHVYFV